MKLFWTALNTFFWLSLCAIFDIIEIRFGLLNTWAEKHASPWHDKWEKQFQAFMKKP